MKPSYELFDHTADMGVRVVAATLAELIPPATFGLYAIIGELRPSMSAEDLTFERDGEDSALLLRDYLAEVLFLFERRARILIRFEEVGFSPRRLSVVAKTAGVDQENSIYYREVKAITYHELGIRPIEGGFEATFIVDI